MNEERVAGIKRERLAETVAACLPGGNTDSRDLLPLYADAGKIREVVSYLAEDFRGKADFVASPESLGFIAGSMLAAELGAGFIGLRKYRNNPPVSEAYYAASYIDHRDMVTTLEVKKTLLSAGSRVLLFDDWIQTAATIQAGMTLLEEAGAELAGIASIGTNFTPATKDMIESGLIRCIYLKK